MIDIRPIRASEGERFLALLCEVFDLDFGRAQAIFFSEPFFDLNRKWALFEHGEMVSILTTVGLEFGWGRAIGIAGVATASGRERQGLAGRLLATVMEESARVGEGPVLLFAKDTRLYERLGFELLDTVIRGPIQSLPEPEVPLGLEHDVVRTIYEAWADQDQNRLRRDDRRWKYWRWNLRVCTPLENGYLCFEGGVVREVIGAVKGVPWHLPPDTEWLGLSSMASQIGVPLLTTTPDLHLMGRGFKSMPQFFMTDQF